MIMNTYLTAALAALLLGAPAAEAASSFQAGKGTFMLDNQPFTVKAAELHYPRIPRPYWENRIKNCKALGMNTICLYVFWNVHETQPGVYDFSGQNDIAEFIRLCDKHDMKVILRPGPYVCAEWEMGGLPWWLLQKTDISLRDTDPYFMERVSRFQDELADHLKGLTEAEGGPIIMVQVENEYGAYGDNKPYVAAIRDIIRKHYPSTLLFQCDWSSNFEVNGLDDLLWTMNFGTGTDVDSQFARLKELRPDSPLMCSEYWSGWFDKWGAGHETRPADEMVAGIGEMLDKGISFSLYMTHGGTNWGHWAGANSPGYSPDVTSYDYDAPIDEAGHLTPKYYSLREVMARHSATPLPEPEPDMPLTAIPEFTLTEAAYIPAISPAADFHTEDIRPMEMFGQGYGSIIYSTVLPAIEAGTTLTVTEAHDFALVCIDGNVVGTLDRRLGEDSLVLGAYPAGARLSIAVEAMGRINFGRAIKDYKGITKSVTLDYQGVTTQLKGWDITLLPESYDFVSGLTFDATPEPGKPLGVYRGTFRVDDPADTYLDMETWGKGLVYVNGRCLGRFWSIGPQQTLYTPGCWLRKGDNEIVVFDLTGPDSLTVKGLTKPIVDMLQLPEAAPSAGAESFSLSGFNKVDDFVLPHASGWAELAFPAPVTARYVALQATDSHDPDGAVAIVEMYLRGADGKRLSREGWKVAYVDSQQTDGNHTAEKAFDLQESTYWTPQPGAPLPHTLVIDLGQDTQITGLDYLPRTETGTPAAISRLTLQTK